MIKPGFHPNAASISVSCRMRHRLRSRWLFGPALALAAAYGAYVGAMPRVAFVLPARVLATETLATSGVVEGRVETTLGSDAQGTLVELRVEENDVVRKGQVLAIVQNRVGDGAVTQAQAALRRAEAGLAQARAGSTPEERRVASAHFQASTEETVRAGQGLDDAEIAASQTKVRFAAAKAALGRAQATRDQAVARRDLAKTQLQRIETLVGEGAMAGVELDRARAEATTAEAAVADADAAIKAANAGVLEANLAVGASTVAVRMAETAVRAAQAAQDATQAERDRVVRLPRPETVAVAEAAVHEAEASLASARALRQNAMVRAPFDGTVTKLLLRPGASVGAAGILRLVATGGLEVVAEVDEGSLRRLKTGMRAALATAAEPKKPIEAKVVRLSAGIDASRGTVEVRIVPTGPALLRPGQTVDATLVLMENVPRLTLPASAVRRTGDKTVAFVVRDGRAVAREVQVGRSSGATVAVLEGIAPQEAVVRDAAALEDGQRVRR